MGEVIYPVEFYGWRDAIKLPPDLRERWNRAEDMRMEYMLSMTYGEPPRCEVIDITPYLERRTYPT